MTITRTQYRYLNEIYEVQPVSMQNLMVLLGIDNKETVGQHVRALISKKFLGKTDKSTLFVTRLGQFELQKGLPPVSAQKLLSGEPPPSILKKPLECRLILETFHNALV